MARKTRTGMAALAIGLIFSSAASATETITYTYDARGRLIKVVHAGNVNNNNQVCYTYDKEGNRTNVKAAVNGSCP
jgi:YD repeat-containing protein